jgi:F0F1-type ATP synthase assembly protein I
MNDNPQKPKSFNKWQVAGLAFELGFIIAIPLVLFGFIGKWLDQKFGTDPWLALASVLLAIVATTVWITRRFREILKP